MVKLRIKIGPHEFEAEGSQDYIKEQFEEFKDLINYDANQQPAEHEQPSTTGTETLEDERVRERLGLLFAHDANRNLISLRIPTTGDHRVADTILLILLGYRLLRNEDELLVTQIKTSLDQSGNRAGRIDRITARYVSDGLMIKTGKAKGGRYRLTNMGIAAAQELMERLLAQVS